MHAYLIEAPDQGRLVGIVVDFVPLVPAIVEVVRGRFDLFFDVHTVVIYPFHSICDQFLQLVFTGFGTSWWKLNSPLEKSNDVDLLTIEEISLQYGLTNLW